MTAAFGFALTELAGLPVAAVVVEERYGALLKVERVQPGWLLELLARMQARYPSVPIVFADSRKLAEEWTYRYLAAAYAWALDEPDALARLEQHPGE